MAGRKPGPCLIFFGGGAQAPWGQVGSIFAGGRCWNPFGCVLGASWSLVGVLGRGFGALGFDFGGLWAFPEPKGVGGMAEPLNFRTETFRTKIFGRTFSGRRDSEKKIGRRDSGK